jgi:hypothetical protein
LHLHGKIALGAFCPDFKAIDGRHCLLVRTNFWMGRATLVLVAVWIFGSA